MKTFLVFLIALSAVALGVYSAYRGLLSAWDWAVEERPHAQAASAIEEQLDKANEATSDTDWVCRALEPKKK